MRILVAACWVVFILVWVVTALRDRRGGSPAVLRRSVWWTSGFAIAAAGFVVGSLVPRRVWAALTVHAAWLSALGAVLLVGSLAFTVWARLRLGRMWNSAPTIKEGHELRTDGPYALVRHPIYTGLLGMLLGTVLVVGFGTSLLALLIVPPALWFKIRTEERLLTDRFPQEYPAYRAAVPALVPGLRRHRSGVR